MPRLKGRATPRRRGVRGALIGGIIASLLGTGDIGDSNTLGFVVAVIAAVLLVGAAEGASPRK